MMEQNDAESFVLSIKYRKYFHIGDLSSNAYNDVASLIVNTKQMLSEDSRILELHTSDVVQRNTLIDTVTLNDVTSHVLFNPCVKVDVYFTVKITIVCAILYEELFSRLEGFFEKTSNPYTSLHFSLEEKKDYPKKGWNRTFGVNNVVYTRELLEYIQTLGSDKTEMIQQHKPLHEYTVTCRATQYRTYTLCDTSVGAIIKNTIDSLIPFLAGIDGTACIKPSLAMFGSLFIDVDNFEITEDAHQDKHCSPVASYCFQDIPLQSTADDVVLLEKLKQFFGERADNRWELLFQISGSSVTAGNGQPFVFGCPRPDYTKELVEALSVKKEVLNL